VFDALLQVVSIDHSNTTDQILNSSRAVHLSEILNAWSDPKEGYVKINCDDSLVDFGTNAYFGGVVRDDRRIPCLLSQNGSSFDSNSITVVELC
jgi:hypothetical protein